MDNELRKVSILFLQQLDNARFTKFYHKELTSRYRRFSKECRMTNGFKYEDVIGFLKWRKLVYIKGSQVVLKPMFINTSMGYLIFTVSPGSEKSGVYFVCQICDRGFSSRTGLFAHQSSDGHQAMLNDLVHPLEALGRNGNQVVYLCPMLDCNFEGRPNELIEHYRTTKIIKVTKEELTQDNDTYRCDLCNVKCNSKPSIEEHNRGQRHKINEFRVLVRENRPNLIQNKGNIRVKFDEGERNSGALYTLTGDMEGEVVRLIIENKSRDSPLTLISFSHFYLYNQSDIILSDPQRVSRGQQQHTIRPHGTYTVEVRVKPKDLGRIRVPVVFTFTRPQGGSQKFVILREILYKCVLNSAILQEIQPVAPYEKPKVVEASNLDIIPSNLKPNIENRIALKQVIRLDHYKVPQKINQLVQSIQNARDETLADTKLSILRNNLRIEILNASNYCVYFNNLLYLEEHQMNRDIAQYTMDSVKMRKEARTGLAVLEVPGLAENRPSVLQGDKMFAIMLEPGDGRKYEAYVHHTEMETVKLGLSDQFTRKFVNNMTFRIEFTINRLSIMLEHRAVSEMTKKLQSVLFPDSHDYVPEPLVKPSHRYKFYNAKVESNREQNMAVKHVVFGTSRPAPYLIYGPPGTGKTMTLVEAIKQVYQDVPNCRILACAPQNAAADLITQRLMEHVDKADMLRLNAPSRAYNDVDTEVQAVSNYISKTGVATTMRHALSSRSNRSDMEVYIPSREDLAKKKVILSTLVTSGRLVSADMVNYFTHIFIDEAGHATEPETVIPITGLIQDAIMSGIQVVLAGDPKQLGPVIRSPIAHDLGMSLLERLMDSGVYARDPDTDQYNVRYVTKLVRSFRSHPEILEVPNVCFYDNELLPCADEIARQKFCNWEGLPTPGFPLIFHGIQGEEEREARSPSWFNTDEVMKVIDYVQKLMDCKSPRVKAKDIGIISPYHQQVNKILRGLKALETQQRGRTRGYADITVGSVEKFQGQEREIIIISTVRSRDAFIDDDKKFNLGFVGNPKRFNVAVTRAKALLIVIGNPAILRRDRNWLRLISHIEEGGGYIGIPPPDEIEGEDIDDLSRRLDAMQIQEALSSGVSEHQQQASQEWRRKE